MTNIPYRPVVDVPVARRLTLIGDIHGKAAALEKILAERDVEAGLAAGTHTLLFLGDIVDRGPTELRDGEPVHVGVERLLDRVIDLRLRFPKQVVSIVGNHEGMHLRDMVDRRLGPGQVSAWGKQGRLTLTAARMEFLRQMPLAARIEVGGTRALLVHGGVPLRAVPVDDFPRDLADVTPLLDTPAVRGLLWTNPSWSRKDPGTNCYTRIHVGDFLRANRATVLIRGHRNEPEIRELPGGMTFICVHTAQGDENRESDADGYVYMTWDAPAPPRLVQRP